MAWEKHTKKISELKDSNTQIDMKVRQRLEEMTDKIANGDDAVSLEYLKDYLHLHKDDNDAIQELKLHVSLMDNLEYSVIVDDNNQSIYIYFKKESE